ncbi:Sodium/hydrogen exchanger 9B2 [Frankliniella fusca]|uniref:Sodium/hydrogen exchanger 9B2 n=1 Tax=Frankliniella fusca TaxID=407009 RepID=A0AAE1GXK2_9NEOP|nr:Sodium/hydrogen exchanger 9B2 [Frankliniella fusca]
MNCVEAASDSKTTGQDLEVDKQIPVDASDDPASDGKTDQDQNATKDIKGHCCIENLSKVTAQVSPNLICPAMTKLHFMATRLEIYAMLGALFYVVISFSWAEPIRDSALQLVGLFITAELFGAITGFARLPPLLGMLLAGVMFRHVGFFHAEGLFLKFTATVRTTAMTMILIRAGLGLDASALLRLSMVVVRLSVIPCTVEATTVAIMSHFLLNFPWHWGFLLGFVLASVSPAVVVPSLIVLQSNGYGEDKGVGTLVIASSSLDNIFSITLFGVVLSTIFSEGSFTEVIIQGPLEVLIGITWGFLMGIISIYIPHQEEKSVIQLRTIMIGASGLLTVLGSQLIGYSGAGPLGCIVGSFVAACGWRAFSPATTYVPVLKNMNDYWLIFQPFLFALIGTEINLRALDVDNTLLGLGIIFVGVLVRICVCCLSVQGCGLNLRETLFIGVSWLPKATVQAVLGPVALDMARSTKDVAPTEYAGQVLTIAVLSIVLTAPIGAIGIQQTGPILLNRSKTEDCGNEDGQPIAELQTIT